jgi:hypothetical protein
MRWIVMLILGFVLTIGLTAPELPKAEAAAQKGRISVRIERFPRPPYSGATYYIYERGGDVICTKLEVCNKYDDCDTEYKKGKYKDEMDVETGEPYGTEKPVFIPTKKLRKHVCLTRFKLL